MIQGHKRKDIDFMSEVQAATRLRPTTASTLLLLSIIALVVFGIVWMAVSEVEELTRGSGQVVPTQEVQIVQSLEGGVLEEILVKDGDVVEQGQILMRISDVQFASEERGTESRLLSLRAKKLRLEAEANGTAFNLPDDIVEKSPIISANEKALYDSRQQELENAYDILDNRIAKARAELSETGAQISRLTESRKLLNEELEITKQMVAQRAVPKLDEIRLTRELADINGQINALTQKGTGLQAELRAAQKEKESQDDVFRSTALTELNEVETEIASLREDLRSIGDRVERAELRAPVDGVVNNIAISTVGGVVEPAMKLIEIVPNNDELKIIAKVSPNDIAFLRPGQNAKVKITAYDPQKYGSLDGDLVRIGATSGSDQEGNIFFEIEVRTQKNFMGDASNPLPITPGMVAEVEVITGKRTILEYLLKPLLRARDRAFTER